MIGTFKELYNISPTLLYVILFLLFLFCRSVSFHVKAFITKEQIHSTEGRLLEYITSKTPWYFTILFLLLIINGLLAIFTKNNTFYESFKYISGSMVGALIGLAEHTRKQNGKGKTS